MWLKNIYFWSNLNPFWNELNINLDFGWFYICGHYNHSVYLFWCETVLLKEKKASALIILCQLLENDTIENIINNMIMKIMKIEPKTTTTTKILIRTMKSISFWYQIFDFAKILNSAECWWYRFWLSISNLNYLYYSIYIIIFNVNNLMNKPAVTRIHLKKIVSKSKVIKIKRGRNKLWYI